MSDRERDANDRQPASYPCSLRQACLKAGLDRGGERCQDCLLRALCQSELRWLVKTVREEVYRC
jgi:hypothetical protein